MHILLIQIHRNDNIGTTVPQNGKIKYIAGESDLKKINSILVGRYSVKKIARDERIYCTAVLRIASFCSALFHYTVDLKKNLAESTVCVQCACSLMSTCVLSGSSSVSGPAMR